MKNVNIFLILLIVAFCVYLGCWKKMDLHLERKHIVHLLGTGTTCGKWKLESWFFCWDLSGKSNIRNLKEKSFFIYSFATSTSSLGCQTYFFTLICRLNSKWFVCTCRYQPNKHQRRQIHRDHEPAVGYLSLEKIRRLGCFAVTIKKFYSILQRNVVNVLCVKISCQWHR